MVRHPSKSRVTWQLVLLPLLLLVGIVALILTLKPRLMRKTTANGTRSQFLRQVHTTINQEGRVWATKNRNPGNLIKTQIAWRGKLPQTSVNGRFEAFDSWYHGIRALYRNLTAYRAQGIITLAAILNRWAPASDGNNTTQYIANAVAATGVPQNVAFPLDDPDKAAKLVWLIATVEAGKTELERFLTIDDVKYVLSNEITQQP